MLPLATGFLVQTIFQSSTAALLRPARLALCASPAWAPPGSPTSILTGAPLGAQRHTARLSARAPLPALHPVPSPAQRELDEVAPLHDRLLVAEHPEPALPHAAERERVDRGLQTATRAKYCVGAHNSATRLLGL
jgi:hypothetical protein